MATIIYNKTQYLEWIASQIEDDDMVIQSSELNGNLQFMGKKNLNRIPFAFAADCFSDSNLIGDIFHHRAFGSAIIITKPKFLSEKAREVHRKDLAASVEPAKESIMDKFQ